MNVESRPRVTAFRWIDIDGNLLSPEKSIDWYKTHNNTGFGPIVGYQWLADGVQFKVGIDTKRTNWYELPDASGFICFEADREPDNCLLLDAFGHIRKRLTVPWHMTGAQTPVGVTFGNIDGPYTNPVDSKMGKFGVSGWVGESKFYFELDHHTGVFLWCKRIWD